IACRCRTRPNLPTALSSSPWPTMVLSSSEKLTANVSPLHNRLNKNFVLHSLVTTRSSCNSRLSLSSRDSQLVIFHTKVNEISPSSSTPLSTRLLFLCFPYQ
ncbi:unnamed protein product, partial [Musa acuminata subsp. burmannicoides]